MMFTPIAVIGRTLSLGRRGGVALHLGLMTAGVIGMAGLGTEVTYLAYKHRQMQVVADAAAISAATADQQGANPILEAQAVAAEMGFVNGAANTTVTVNTPPDSGPHASDKDAYEVIVTQPQTMVLAGLFRSNVFDVRTRAVALQGGQAPICILALDTNAPEALEVGEKTALTSRTCGIASNSKSNKALVMEGGSYTYGPVSVVGGWQIGSPSQMKGGPNRNHAATVDDPYADVAVLTPPSCTAQSTGCHSVFNQKVVNLNPGHYCNGWEFESNAVVNLSPGTYYVDKQLKITNGVTVNATGGVTIIVNTNYDMKMEDAATLNIKAPTSGNYAGVAFMSRRDSDAGKKHNFSDKIKLNVDGAIYFPNQTVEFENMGVSGNTGCMQIIARKVELEGNVHMDNTCTNSGVIQMVVKQTQLVE